MNENQVIKFLSDLLKNKQGVKDIQNAIDIDSQTSFLTDRMHTEKDNKYSKKFLGYVAAVLNNPESETKFKSNLKFPLEINGFSNQIFEKLQKIWDGQNKSITVLPQSLSDKIEVNYSFYQNELFDYYFKLPNTLVVIFNGENGVNRHFVKSKDLVSFGKDIEGEFDHVLFTEGKMHWYFDKKIFVKFKIEEDEIILQPHAEEKRKEGGETRYIAENLTGKVNIFHVSNEKYNLNSDFVRTNKLGDYLTAMVFLQMLYIYSKITDPYAFFLILQKYSPNKCNYQDRFRNINCSGGYLFVQKENSEPLPVQDENGGHKPCPSCNQSTAPGSTIKKSEKMVIGKANDVVDEMLSFIAPPVDNLRYSEEFLEKFENKLMRKICGETTKLNERVCN